MEPKRVRKGDPVTADNINAVIDYAKRNEIRAGAGIQVANLPNGKLLSVVGASNGFFGIITDDAGEVDCNGEVDFMDNRYYVQRARVDLDEEDDDCARLTFVAETDEDEEET